MDDVADMVIDVLAMLVAGTTLRAPGGVGSKILACRDRSLGRLPKPWILVPKLQRLEGRLDLVKKMSTSPGSGCSTG